MRVFYDQAKNNIVLEGIGVYFPNGTMEAIIEEGKISVRNKNTEINKFHLDFSDVNKEDGSPSGADINESISYLNAEFEKGQANGVSEFSGILTTQVVNDDRINSDDMIAITPVVAALTDEILVVTNVVDGAFTAGRVLGNSGGVGGLTNGLPFRWKVI